MKTFLSLAVIFSLISCEKKPSDQKTQNSKKMNLDYLVGEWSRTNGPKEHQTFEIWKKLNDSTYLGHGYTISKNDTVWQENTMISKVEKDWFLQVKTPQDTLTTDFKLTEMTDSSFVCENPQNEFPKVIKYFKNRNGLGAEISDDKDKILYEFSPIN